MLKTYAVVLDIHNPIEDTSSGEFIDDIDRPLTEALFKIGKRIEKIPFAPKYDEALKNADAMINLVSGEYYIAEHPISKQEMMIPQQVIVNAFHEHQIHILGSVSDAKRFQEFVKREK